MARDPNKYIVDGYRYVSVTEVLQFSGWARYDKVDPVILNRAAERGSLVHDATELVDDGTFVESEFREDLSEYIIGYQKFVEEHDYSVLESEIVVFNHKYKYAGQLDRICMLDGKKTLLDIKTSSQRKPEWGLQLAAYEMAYGQTLERRVALRLGLGFYEIDNYQNDNDYVRFLEAVKIVQDQRNAGVIEIK
jgi:hypothetical protein